MPNGPDGHVNDKTRFCYDIESIGQPLYNKPYKSIVIKQHPGEGMVLPQGATLTAKGSEMSVEEQVEEKKYTGAIAFKLRSFKKKEEVWEYKEDCLQDEGRGYYKGWFEDIDNPIQWHASIDAFLDARRIPREENGVSYYERHNHGWREEGKNGVIEIYDRPRITGHHTEASTIAGIAANFPEGVRCKHHLPKNIVDALESAGFAVIRNGGYSGFDCTVRHDPGLLKARVTRAVRRDAKRKKDRKVDIHDLSKKPFREALRRYVENLPNGTHLLDTKIWEKKYGRSIRVYFEPSFGRTYMNIVEQSLNFIRSDIIDQAVLKGMRQNEGWRKKILNLAIFHAALWNTGERTLSRTLIQECADMGISKDQVKEVKAHWVETGKIKVP